MLHEDAYIPMESWHAQVAQDAQTSLAPEHPEHRVTFPEWGLGIPPPSPV
jgi:hypothetical protein